jgi:hypothetical protein
MERGLQRYLRHKASSERTTVLEEEKPEFISFRVRFNPDIQKL